MGVLASSGRFNICFAFAVVFGAALLADCLWFRVGLSAANGWFRRLCSTHWNERFPKIAGLVCRGLLGTIFTAKFSLLPSALVPLAAGSTRLSARRFLYTAAVGNGAFTVVYLVGGFAAGYASMSVLGHGSVLVAATLACCLLMVLPAAIQCVKRWIVSVNPE
jgi:membrane protein DedA with SNARE-associated domain